MSACGTGAHADNHRRIDGQTNMATRSAVLAADLPELLEPGVFDFPDSRIGMLW
jgi:hypothetical protein